ncbi:MAG: type 1 glutamine amidotransferase [Synergistaceae bacterium]|jgi:protease I|nr:type 1 glutamine amidotransferase [Synergistaceae bacterium]
MLEAEGKKILIFVENTFEDLELLYPRLRLIEAGAKVLVAGPQAGHVYVGKNGYPFSSDIAIDDVKVSDFDGLVIPGGFAPDKLRRLEKVKSLTREFMEAGKLVAHICHAGWIPISAGICRGYKMTSVSAIKDDLVNAGAEWVDEEAVIDRNMVSSRTPVDLPAFMQAIFKVLAK